MKVIVGLGNPGSRYRATRHNVGYAVIDLLAQSPGTSRFQSHFEAEIAERTEEGDKVLLVRPETFMNLSGRCVRQVVDYYDVPLRDLLVICDDVNLPLGKQRWRARGTHGGHNGLRDIQTHLGTTVYSRLRIGVGAPEENEMIDYVLGKFRPSERPIIDESLQLAVQAADYWIQNGIEKTMNQYNG
jgi:PTH1 family peptidyl-tRNA hydrolase